MAFGIGRLDELGVTCSGSGRSGKRVFILDLLRRRGLKVERFSVWRLMQNTRNKCVLEWDVPCLMQSVFGPGYIHRELVRRSWTPPL